MLITLKLQKHANGSVIAFKGDTCVAHWPSWKSKKPDYRFKYVMLNCYKYRIEWDKTPAIGNYDFIGV